MDLEQMLQIRDRLINYSFALVESGLYPTVVDSLNESVGVVEDIIESNIDDGTIYGIIALLERVELSGVIK